MTSSPPQLPAPGGNSPAPGSIKPASAEQRLRSLTRLLIGSAEISLDGLWASLQQWEASVDSQENLGPETDNPELLEGEFTNDDLILVKPDSLSQTARYALIGMMMEGQERLGPGLKTLARLEGSLERRLLRAARPVTHSRFLSPLGSAYNRLVDRGQSEVDRWVETGRREEARSRRLAQTAMKTSVDSSIDYLTHNQEVQELVQTQSTGLATEVIEEVRERTFSADTYLENWLRKIFRMKPRSAIPGPPEDVLQRAMTVHIQDIDKTR
jgi:hypothetical protein